MVRVYTFAPARGFDIFFKRSSLFALSLRSRAKRFLRLSSIIEITINAIVVDVIVIGNDI